MASTGESFESYFDRQISDLSKTQPINLSDDNQLLQARKEGFVYHFTIFFNATLFIKLFNACFDIRDGAQIENVDIKEEFEAAARFAIKQLEASKSFDEDSLHKIADSVFKTNIAVLEGMEELQNTVRQAKKELDKLFIYRKYPVDVLIKVGIVKLAEAVRNTVNKLYAYRLAMNKDTSAEDKLKTATDEVTTLIGVITQLKEVAAEIAK